MERQLWRPTEWAQEAENPLHRSPKKRKLHATKLQFLCVSIGIVYFVVWWWYMWRAEAKDQPCSECLECIASYVGNNCSLFSVGCSHCGTCADKIRDTGASSCKLKAAVNITRSPSCALKKQSRRMIAAGPEISRKWTWAQQVIGLQAQWECSFGACTCCMLRPHLCLFIYHLCI
jgi:hypothetical protein